MKYYKTRFPIVLKDNRKAIIQADSVVTDEQIINRFTTTNIEIKECDSDGNYFKNSQTLKFKADSIVIGV